MLQALATIALAFVAYIMLMLVLSLFVGMLQAHNRKWLDRRPLAPPDE